jgi:hypothetical protein
MPEYMGVYEGLVDLNGAQTSGINIPESNLRRRFHRNGSYRDVPIDVRRDYFRTVPCRHRNASSVIANFMFEQSLRPEVVRSNGTVVPAGVLVRKAAARWNATRKNLSNRKKSRRSNRSKRSSSK